MGRTATSPSDVTPAAIYITPTPRAESVLEAPTPAVSIVVMKQAVVAPARDRPSESSSESSEASEAEEDGFESSSGVGSTREIERLFMTPEMRITPCRAPPPKPKNRWGL